MLLNLTTRFIVTDSRIRITLITPAEPVRPVDPDPPPQALAVPAHAPPSTPAPKPRPKRRKPPRRRGKGIGRGRKKGQTYTRIVQGMEPAAYPIRPIPAGSKRQRFLDWFTGSPGGRTVAATMAELSMTRPAVWSSWKALAVEHGIGYGANGDHITAILPISMRE